MEIYFNLTLLSYLDPTFVGLSPFTLAAVHHTQVVIPTSKLLHVFNVTEELPEENLFGKMSKKKNNTILFHPAALFMEIPYFFLTSSLYTFPPRRR